MGKTSKSKPTPAHDAWRDFLLFCENQETSQQVYRGVGSVDYELVSKVGRSASYSGQKEINVFNLFEARSQLYHSIQALSKSSSGQGRLPESLHFAESAVILGVVRARSVHKVGYGHNCDWAAA